MRAKSYVTLGRSLTFSGALSFHLDSKCWRCFPRQQGNSCPSSLGDLIRPSTPGGRIQGEGVLAARGRAITHPTPSACLKSSILRHLRLPGEPLTWSPFQLSLYRMDREEDGRRLSHRSPLSLPATETMESAIHRDQITHSSCVERVWGGGRSWGC